MSAFPYSLSKDEGALPRFGVIVLQVDETIEGDLRALLPTRAAKLHGNRIPSGAELTSDALRAMQDNLPAAAALLPDVPFDVVAFACTSATAVYGRSAVAAMIRKGRATRHVTDPMTALIAAASALGLERIGLVSPYVPTVADPLVQGLEAAGLNVPASVSFGEQVERNVARIDGPSIKAAAGHVAGMAEVDGIFLSCTNLQTLHLIDELEQDLDRPVLSSNQVLAWHMAAVAGVTPARGAPGRLFRPRA